MDTTIPTFVGFPKTPWNKGRLIGQKRPLKPKEVWAIRVRLQLQGRKRDLALFNLAIERQMRIGMLEVDRHCSFGTPAELEGIGKEKFAPFLAWK